MSDYEEDIDIEDDDVFEEDSEPETETEDEDSEESENEIFDDEPELVSTNREIKILKMTTFEMVKILAERAIQIDEGSVSTIPFELPDLSNIENRLKRKHIISLFDRFQKNELNSKEIAELEFLLDVIPEYSIIRTFPNKKTVDIKKGEFKYFPVY